MIWFIGCANIFTCDCVFAMDWLIKTKTKTKNDHLFYQQVPSSMVMILEDMTTIVKKLNCMRIVRACDLKQRHFIILIHDLILRRETFINVQLSKWTFEKRRIETFSVIFHCFIDIKIIILIPSSSSQRLRSGSKSKNFLCEFYSFFFLYEWENRWVNVGLLKLVI